MRVPLVVVNFPISLFPPFFNTWWQHQKGSLLLSYPFWLIGSASQYSKLLSTLYVYLTCLLSWISVGDWRKAWTLNYVRTYGYCCSNVGLLVVDGLSRDRRNDCHSNHGMPLQLSRQFLTGTVQIRNKLHMLTQPNKCIGNVGDSGVLQECWKNLPRLMGLDNVCSNWPIQ